MMSTNLQYFSISGLISSGPVALPSLRLSVTFLYSSRVKAVMSILCVSFKSKLRSALTDMFSSPFLSLPSNFLKCSYHILTLSSLLFAFIIPFFVFLRPVISFINFQHLECLDYWFVNSTCSVAFCCALLSTFMYILRKLSFAFTSSS